MIPESVLLIFEIMLLIAIGLAVARMAKGPHASDRMAAVDLLSLLVALFLIAHAIRMGEEALLDVVLVFSVIVFFGTVGLARYLQREVDEPEDDQ